MLKPRQVHNTNSPNFIKLDWTDLNHILSWSEDLELSQDETVTRDRVAFMKQLMEEKRAESLKGREE